MIVEEDLWQRQSRLQMFEDWMFTVAIYIHLKNHHQAIVVVGIVISVVGLDTDLDPGKNVYHPIINSILINGKGNNSNNQHDFV